MLGTGNELIVYLYELFPPLNVHDSVQEQHSSSFRTKLN